MHRVRTSLAVAFLLGVMGVIAPAQAFPERPVRMVMPYAAGGGPDAIARRVAQAMGQHLGKPVVVDNKPGAATAIGVQSVASAAADGHTILFSAATSFSINPHVFRALPYKADDFVHVGLIVETPLVMVSHASVGASSVQDLVQMHKRDAEPPIVATNGKGGFSHLTAAMFYGSQALPFVDAPYKGEGAVLPDLLNGQVKFFFGTIPGLMPHVESGKLKAFAVTSSARSPKAPGVPTFQELGVPVLASAWFGIAVPKGTPQEVVLKLRAALESAMADKDVQDRLAADGSIPLRVTGAAAERYIHADSEKWGRLVRSIQAGGLELN